jgi:hypothetical protein
MLDINMDLNDFEGTPFEKVVFESFYKKYQEYLIE